MDFREKDTAIILGCCMLVVLLVIFFLSERRKFTHYNLDHTPEGTRDSYQLTVKKYKIINRDREQPHMNLTYSRVMNLDRIVLALGADLKGQMLVLLQAPAHGRLKAYHNRITSPVDLNTQFVPEGACNLNFFDADLINFRGQMLRKGEAWEYFRDLSLYGSSEVGQTIQYTFAGKKNINDQPMASIAFNVPNRTWIEKGLNTLEQLEGSFLVDEKTGKLNSFECSYKKENERESYLYEITLVLQGSRLLPEEELARLRRGTDYDEFMASNAIQPVKPIPGMWASGTGDDVERLIEPFTQPAQPVPVKKYTLQLKAFKDKNRAIHLVKVLKKKGGNAFILKKEGLYKVCIGKYGAGSTELQHLKKALIQAYPGCFIRQVP